MLADAVATQASTLWRSRTLTEHGVDLRVLHQGIDTSTPGGKLTFHILGAIAELERDLISERTRDGLNAARARGRKGGHRPKMMTPAKLETARKLYDGHEHTVAQIARIIGLITFLSGTSPIIVDTAITFDLA